MEKKQILITSVISCLVLNFFAFIPYSYADTTLYDVARNNSRLIGNNAGSSTNRVIGEEVTSTSSLAGEGFDKITVYLWKAVGCCVNPHTIYIGVWNASDAVNPTQSNALKLIASFDKNTLSDIVGSSVTFTFSGYNIPVGGGVVIGVADFTSPNEFISAGYNTGNLFNGTNTRLSRQIAGTSGWTDDTTNDFAMKLELTGGSQFEFCQQPENLNILICRLGGDGTLGSAGAFIVGNTTSGTGLLGIGCSIGLVDCVADSNPQTNGLGLLIFIASLFVIVGMFFRTIGAENTFHMPIFIWIIIIISLSAFFTITGLIDPVFLILSVIALIALGAPKIVNIVRGGSTMGGGSTE